MNLCFIIGFGVIGVIARYGADLLTARWSTLMPVGTLTVNLTGSFIAGVVFAIGSQRTELSEPLRVGLLVGFCGGFTTFSAYCLQSLLLMERGQWMPALLYFVLSPPLGLAAAYLGLCSARFLNT